MTARTIEGKAYAVPYDTFESPVTVGGERYIVGFKVTESPSGGTVVHSVDIVKSPETEFRALYDQYVKSGAGNQNIESGAGEGYNGSGFDKEHSAGSTADSTVNGIDVVDPGGLNKRITALWYKDGATQSTATSDTGKLIVDDPFDDTGYLKANVIYQSGEFYYNYETDSQGRLEQFQTDDLRLTERTDRLPHNPNTPGKVQGDHAGHLAGDRFGGSPHLDNLVSQSSDVNLRQYKKIEDQWAKAIKEGRLVQTRVDVVYEGNSKRPTGFNITYKIDGKAYFKFLKN
jgi:hypothetical protein